MDIAVLILRLVIGTSMAAHGAQTLFGWFGGRGLKSMGSWSERIGFQPGVVFALMAGLTEVAARLTMQSKGREGRWTSRLTPIAVGSWVLRS